MKNTFLFFFTQFYTDWYYIWGRFLGHTVIIRLPASNSPYLMFAFRKVCWRQCLYFHCLNKKWDGGTRLRGTSTAHYDHTVPSCPRQTKSRLSISQNWFSRDVLQKDEMCRMQHREALRFCLSCVHKVNVGVCLNAFVVPHFLGSSRHFFCAHMQTQHAKKFKSQPSHSSTQAATLRVTSDY